MNWFTRLVPIAVGTMSFASTGLAQEKTPFPPFTGERVYVAGAARQFGKDIADIGAPNSLRWRALDPVERN